MTAVPVDPAATRDSVVPGALRRAALDGARAITPMVIGVIPLALAIGAAIGTSSVPALAGWLGGPLIFAGGAQLTAIEMLDAGAAPAVIIASALALNARIAMYGAAIAPWFRDASRRRRLLLAVPLIDPLYFTAVTRFEEGGLDGRERQAFYAGGAVFLAAVWLGVQGVAVLAQTSLPESLGLHLAAPLAFVGLLAKSVTGRTDVLAAAVAALAATVGAGLPFQSGVLVASLVGVVAAVVTTNVRSRP